MTPYCELTPGCDSPKEGTTLGCSGCNREARKAAKLALREPKKRKPIKKVSKGQKFITDKLHELYTKMDEQREDPFCSAYPNLFWDDHDHTISQKRCKELGKPALIADPGNIEYSSRKAHAEWESYKSGVFRNHANFWRRMAFVKKHDPEGWAKRMTVANADSIDMTKEYNTKEYNIQPK